MYIRTTRSASNSVKELVEGLHRILHSHQWNLRHRTCSWVRWIHRERNRLADQWANYVLDTGFSYLYTELSAELSRHNSNYVIMCDGAYRASCKKASAAWAVIRFRHSRVSLVAAGAALLHECPDSMRAEMSALQMGMHAFTHFCLECKQSITQKHFTTINLTTLPRNIVDMYLEAGVVV